MADQHPVEGSSTSGTGRESFESVVELNIKTLDSQIHSFQVDKNTPVSLLKEKIASQIGLPVGQQRLIFRGKVLKDDHLLSEYHVENGHTLHLVARQSSESQPPSTSSGETSANNGNRGHNANAAGLQNRIGQISQSVVIGPLNVGDQSQGIVPDLSRIVGAVLNSIGMGSQAATNVIGGVQPTVQFSTAVRAGQGNLTEGIRSNTGSQGEVGTQAQPGQASPSQSFAQPIPDSLHTLSEFMNRMELALSQNGYQPNQSPTNSGDLPTVELPSNARGLSTPEALSFVLHHAQRLLSNQTIAVLSHIAGRLEQEGGSTDPTVRGEIHTEAMQVGLAMQHLGALLLELGRTILTLRMGQSPAESYVNAGPAVYISPSGPNPIMVQPFPLQTNSLFGGSTDGPSNPVTFGPIGMGAVPRLVNIHIHSAVGPRVSNAEALLGEHGNQSVSSSSSQSRLPTDSTPPSTVIADVNSRPRNSFDNIRNENQGPPGQADSSTVQNPSVRPSAGNSEVKNQLRNLADNGAGEVVLSVPGSVPEREGQKAHPQHNQHSNENGESVVSSKDIPSSSSTEGSIDYSNGDTTLKTGDDLERAPGSGQGIDNPNAAASVPLGLGLGVLQPQRLTRQPRSLGKVSDGANSSTPNQTQQTRADGQQDLQSLASFPNSRNTNIPSSTQMPPPLGHIMESVQMGGQGADGQFDIASAMSQVLHSPALNGLLAGASEQTGVGSPDVLRNMLEQLTQSPSMRNTLNQITQQFDSQDLGNMSSGFGRGQGAGINLASMVQQMMPIVSQALSGGSAIPQPIAMGPDPETQYNCRRSCREDKANDQNSQIDLHQVVERIEHQDQPGDIFHSIVESASHLYDSSSCAEDLVDELSHQEDLANEFMEILRQDLSQRVKGECQSAGKS